MSHAPNGSGHDETIPNQNSMSSPLGPVNSLPPSQGGTKRGVHRTDEKRSAIHPKRLRFGIPGGVLRARAVWVSVAVLLLFAFASAVTLPVSMRWYNVQELDTAVRHAPSFAPVVSIRQYAKTPHSERPSRWIRFSHRTTSWLGHDDLGRSLVFRIMPGFLVSLGIGLSAAVMAIFVGATWGAVAAWSGGRIGSLMMRVVDVLYGLPYILMVILLKIALSRPLAAMFGGYTKAADLVILLVAIGGVSWLTLARVVRGQVLSLRGQAFIEAARASGAGPVYILVRHLLPNLIGPIIVYATLVVPQAILQESFLSFLGIGVQQPTPSLGRLAADGVQAVNMYVDSWWLIVFPCSVLVLSLLALNFIGDALRDRFDPKSPEAAWV